MKTLRRPQGFTLVEIMVVVAVLGLVAVGIAQAMSDRAGQQTRYYNEKHQLNNDKIKAALLEFASDENFANKGVVPPPYTGDGYASTIYDPADATATGLALASALAQAGVPQKEINDDGVTTPHIRAYQLVSNLVITTALDGPGTDPVTLRYQFGAIYQTACTKGDNTCAPNPATGVPGTSAALTATNIANGTWNTSGTDGTPTTFSTLKLQKIMLGETVRRMRTIQDKSATYFNAMLIKSAAGDATNFYPSGSSSLAGANPGTNQGCRDGWYALNTGDILSTFNLSIGEYGTTKWGGVIEFCRDYDPTGTKAPDATPHFAAIRINKDVTRGIAPDPAVIGNNVIMTH